MKIPIIIIALLIICSHFSPSSAQDDQKIDVLAHLIACPHGNTCPGIAKMKKLFHRYGYLNSSYSDFSDYFDEYLKHAIKTYQLNFNLRPTGQFDQITLHQISQPRCGYPDIINGTTRMASGSPTFLRYSFYPNKERWPKNRMSLKYAFKDALGQDARDVFKKAFSRWSSVSRFTFAETSDYKSADIHIGFYKGYPFDGPGNFLALASAPPDGMFQLDADETWVLNGNFSKLDRLEYDLESVSVHEIGHLLGLQHSSDKLAVMFPVIDKKTVRVKLGDDDVKGITELYSGSTATAR